MAGMAGDHRATTPLRHVANEKSRPAIEVTRIGSEALKKIKQPGMTPVAIAREPHHLPIRAIDGRSLPPLQGSLVRMNRWHAPQEEQPARRLAALVVCLWMGSAATDPHISNSSREVRTF